MPKHRLILFSLAALRLQLYPVASSRPCPVTAMTTSRAIGT